MIGAAVVGLGWWGKVLARELTRSGRFHIRRLVDVRPEAAQSVTEPAGAPFSTRYGEALDDAQVDAIFLTTSHTEHDSQIAAAAQAYKHVFAEKPLSLTAAGARAYIAACHQAGVVLGVGHERRWEPPMQEMLRSVRGGVLGRPLQIEANFSHDKFLALAPDNWRLSARQAPGAGMTATGIHLLDLAIAALGPARTVVARCATLASRFEGGDTISTLIEHASGAHSTINVMLATPFISYFRVFGDQGWIEIRDKAHLEAPAGWQFSQSGKDGEVNTREFPVAAPVRDNLTAFADAIEHKSPYPITPAAMLHTIEALEAIFTSARDRTHVTLPN